MFLRFTKTTCLIIICFVMFAFSHTAQASKADRSVLSSPREIMHAFAFAGFRQDKVEYDIKEGCETFRWKSVILKVERYAITDRQIIIDLAEVGVIATGPDWSVPDTAYIYDITILTKPWYHEAMYDWGGEVTEGNDHYVRGLPEWLEEAIKDIEPTILFTR